MGLGIAITVAIIIAVVLGVLLGRYYAPDDRALRRGAGHAKAYLRALNHVLARDSNRAIEELREVVNDNVDDPEPYFALGALFRSRGEWERAIRVHQSLAIRESASRSGRQRAQYELGMDFRSAGMPRRATKAMESCLELDSRHEGALRTLAGLYEEQGAFFEASTMWARLRAVRDEQPRARDHHLAVAAAQEAVADGDLAAAAARLREAEDSGSLTAHYWVAAAELSMASGELAAAVEPWCAALAMSPDLAGVIAPRLQVAVEAAVEKELVSFAAQGATSAAKASGGGDSSGSPVASDPHSGRRRVVELLDELAERLTPMKADAPIAGGLGSQAVSTDSSEPDSGDEEVVVLGLAAAEVEAGFDPAASAERLASLVARFPSLLTVRILGARAALAKAEAAAGSARDGELLTLCRALVAPSGPLAWAAGGAWRCEACSHVGENLFWRCERCRRWGTVQLDVAFLERAPRPLPRERRAELRAKRPGVVGGLPGASLAGGLSVQERLALHPKKRTVLGRVGRFVSDGWIKARGAPRDPQQKE